MHKPLPFLLLLLAWIPCQAQTPLQGLVAGQSVREDVERIAGKPVQNFSPTLVEYHPAQFNPRTWSRVAKLYVQYRPDSPIVERLEILLTQPMTHDEAITSLNHSAANARLWNLPDQPSSRGMNGPRLVEYFGAPYYLAITYQGGDENSGVARIGRYSPALFTSAVKGP